MFTKEEINQLKQAVLSDDWEIVQAAVIHLGKIGGDEVTLFLISVLESDDAGLRNCSALELASIKDNRAVEPLLKAILKKENHNRNGTMVFALQSLDCSNKLKEIFQIIFFETFEAKMGAYSILSEQEFYFKDEDLLEIKAVWEDIKLHPEKSPDFGVGEAFDWMEDAVEGFMSHLDKE